MQHRRGRFSPSLVLALVALFVALSGTALAAGEFVIDNPDQVAPGVITGLHIKQQAIGKPDLDDPYLKVRVNSNGTPFGSKNDLGAPGVQKLGVGIYDVTFNSTTINGADGTFDETLFSKNCAIEATPVNAARQLYVQGPTLLGPDTVRVHTIDLVDGASTGNVATFQAHDNAFDLVVVC
jgi:hypothetical protein